MPKLTNATCRALNTAGRFHDGRGLYLQVRDQSRKSWLFRFMLDGRARQMGLGPFGDSEGAVTLAKARDEAAKARVILASRQDPIEVRRQALTAQRNAARSARTFDDAAAEYLRSHQDAWRNPKHRDQWTSTLAAYASPVLGPIDISTITTHHVLDCLRPIWRSKTETATRVRSRIEAVLDFATVRGWRAGENPARWRGHLDTQLPAPTRIKPLRHHAALPWDQVGAFMETLRARDGMAARALEFAVLTAARSGEVMGARWREIDIDKSVWTIPADRMKARREHRVPLTDAAMDVLRKVRLETADPDAFVFPGERPGKPLSTMALAMVLRRMGRRDITVHGFRSAFRDWARETTNFPREVAEQALAHTIESAVEAAYARGDLLAKRAGLMTEWAAFCGRSSRAATVASMSEHRSRKRRAE